MSIQYFMLLFVYSIILFIFAAEKKINVMTAVQLNAEILRNLGALAEDESMLKRVAKYLRKLVAEKEADPTLFTKEEFFRMVDEAKKGPSKRFDSVEELDRYIWKWREKWLSLPTETTFIHLNWNAYERTKSKKNRQKVAQLINFS